MIKNTNFSPLLADRLSYSLIAKLLFILLPIAIYALGYFLALDTKEALKASSSSSVSSDMVIMGLASFQLRMVGIISFVLGLLRVLNGAPGLDSPKWMVKIKPLDVDYSSIE